ncbi:aspartate kinase [Parasphaerochaeta coccoides]|uniref:Aspartokinase n=1 Tax=Parasphaerochaeta coccoides (strain ATCC BAA-1237 / DSM 17374 / SPN1) TaxID=760011 RepID=F4GH23_PARC1|nr:aspartate kinase [Parasphaerochaeta coccoides]AEC01498.1 aspartate kinase [Parasphaerochaeta coccoides DSM 17374]
MIICKFGGSSVADAAHVKKVKAILHEDNQRNIVIVSAPGRRFAEDEKVTDMLYKCAALVAEGKSCLPVFRKIEDRYRTIIRGLGMDETLLDEEFKTIREDISSSRGADYAASRGEYLSARLVAEYLGWKFIDTAPLIVVKSDGTPDDSSLLHLSQALSSDGRYVLPGFYGVNAEGQIKTFSRGGSDITGAIVARAAKAEAYENWTDVSGIFAADPRIVPDAHVISEMTYSEVRDLAAVGAGVFHEEAIAPVIPLNIPVIVKNTNAPKDAGTRIVPRRDTSGRPLAGVSSKKGYTRLMIHKLMLFKQPGIRHALLTLLHVFGVRPEYSTYGIDSIVWFYDNTQTTDAVAGEMVERLRQEFELDRVELTSGHAVIGIVGEAIMDVPGKFAHGIQSLDEHDIPVCGVTYGVSEVSALIVVKETHATEAVKILYETVLA